MNTLITPLVEKVVVERLRSRASFTALDISNALKSDRYAVTHGEVAEIVRDIYQTGAMRYYDYDRRLIDVMTEGRTMTRAFLYLHSGAKEREYTARQQGSLSRVRPQDARDPPDSLPTVAVPPPPRPARHSRPPSGSDHRRRGRQDGTLAIPRALISRLGWTVGMSLGLTTGANSVRLTPDGEVPVQVWGGERIRICRRKLCLCGLLRPDTLTVTLDGGALRIVTGDDGDEKRGGPCGPPQPD